MPYLGACEICLYLGNVVRDHNHTTGYIRGWLCNRCNRYLGVLENRHRFAGTYPKDVPKKLFKWWKWQFAEEIARHLAKNTGILYEGDNQPATLPPRERAIETLGIRKPPPPRREKKGRRKRGKKPKPPRVYRRVLSKSDVEAEAALADYRSRLKLWKHPNK